MNFQWLVIIISLSPLNVRQTRLCPFGLFNNILKTVLQSTISSFYGHDFTQSLDFFFHRVFIELLLFFLPTSLHFEWDFISRRLCNFHLRILCSSRRTFYMLPLMGIKFAKHSVRVSTRWLTYAQRCFVIISTFLDAHFESHFICSSTYHHVIT